MPKISNNCEYICTDVLYGVDNLEITIPKHVYLNTFFVHRIYSTNTHVLM